MLVMFQTRLYDGILVVVLQNVETMMQKVHPSTRFTVHTLKTQINLNLKQVYELVYNQTLYLATFQTLTKLVRLSLCVPSTTICLWH